MKRTPTIDQDLWRIHSPNVLIDEIQEMVPRESQIFKIWMNALLKFESVLLALNGFAAVIALSLGMNGRVAALLWGSLRLILKVSRLIVFLKIGTKSSSSHVPFSPNWSHC